MRRFFLSILLLFLITALAGQTQSNLTESEKRLITFLSDTSLKEKWKSGMLDIREGISQTFVSWNKQPGNFKSKQGRIWRARLLSILGRPDSIANYQNSKEYCKGWRQEYIYYIRDKSDVEDSSKIERQQLVFVFDQCEKNLLFVELRPNRLSRSR